MGNYTVYRKVHVLVDTEQGEGRQHRRRFNDELNVNLKPRPLASAVVLFKEIQ